MAEYLAVVKLIFCLPCRYSSCKYDLYLFLLFPPLSYFILSSCNQLSLWLVFICLYSSATCLASASATFTFVGHITVNQNTHTHTCPPFLCVRPASHCPSSSLATHTCRPHLFFLHSSFLSLVHSYVALPSSYFLHGFQLYRYQEYRENSQTSLLGN